MTILDRIKEHAVLVRAAADDLIDEVEECQQRLAGVFGALAPSAPRKRAPRRPPPEFAGPVLTERESKIRQLLEEKRQAPKKAAELLGVSPSTVYLARVRYQRKLGIFTKRDARRSKIDGLEGKKKCPKCGLRGEHDCLKGDGTDRKVVE